MHNKKDQNKNLTKLFQVLDKRIICTLVSQLNKKKTEKYWQSLRWRIPPPFPTRLLVLWNSRFQLNPVLAETKYNPKKKQSFKKQELFKPHEQAIYIQFIHGCMETKY